MTLKYITSATIIGVITLAVSFASAGYDSKTDPNATNVTTATIPADTSSVTASDMENCTGVTKDGKDIMLPRGICEKLNNGVVSK